ncbi:TIGR02679 family protein [Streptomyces sp. NBC_00057]|uniref:TIGR02679 family protein n=1 Tax=Streptomyces sp. NBC_00057 TaxID=2975634 RepID=UPI00324DF82D
MAVTPPPGEAASPDPGWATHAGDRPRDDGRTHPGPAPIDLVRLRRLLGAPELAWLVERIRRRLEREEPLTGSVSLADPDAAGRGAVERLLGRAPRRGRSLSVRLEAVDHVLRRSGISPDGLAAAIRALTGPVVPVRAERDEKARAWAEAYAPLDALVTRRPELAEWADRMRGEGLVRRLAPEPRLAAALLADTASALDGLPVEPAMSLPAFAARALGNAHALDDGTALATLVLSALRRLSGRPPGSGAQWRRETWASAGLVRDELSSTVLALNVRGTPALDLHADAGEPVVLTLRQLTRHPSSPRTRPTTVRICENPAVVAAAADAHGTGCAPLICLQGQPSAAALALLGTLHAQGSTLLYHGDFDWGGLRIASTLLRHVAWLPWRYTATEYRTAVGRTTPLAPLTGRPVDSPWDPGLRPALVELGVRVEEESVLDDLLTDLLDDPSTRNGRAGAQ